MTADQKTLVGGDGTIIFADTSRSVQNTQADNVNQLIMQCATSRESLCTLYNMFKKSVFAVAFSITGDYHLAEDCVSETFIRLTEIKHFKDKNGNGVGFILTIARNIALELHRRYKKECISMVIQSYGDADDTVEDSIFLNQLMKELNDKQRQIIVMRIYSELSFKEIASIMRCPESTVKSRYKRAVQILQAKAGVK